MNVVFWLMVLLLCFIIWYFLSKFFIKIGDKAERAKDNIKKNME